MQFLCEIFLLVWKIKCHKHKASFWEQVITVVCQKNQKLKHHCVALNVAQFKVMFLMCSCLTCMKVCPNDGIIISRVDSCGEKYQWHEKCEKMSSMVKFNFFFSNFSRLTWMSLCIKLSQTRICVVRTHPVQHTEAYCISIESQSLYFPSLLISTFPLSWH